MEFKVTVDDAEVTQALAALAERTANLKPLLQEVGEDIMERAKQRFGTSTGPDGQRWQPNAASTVLESIGALGSKAWRKDGSLSRQAQKTLTRKKVLVDTGSLARQFVVRADGQSVTIGNTMVYAGIHQFGGQAGRGRKVTIPARPFLPVTASGELYPDDRALVLDQLQRFLQGALD